MGRSKAGPFSGLVPTTWLDSLLTGPTAVVGQPPYDCAEVERLLRAVRDRIHKAEVEAGLPCTCHPRTNLDEGVA